MTFCAYCGKEIPAYSSFCPNCGKPVATTGTVEPSAPTFATAPYVASSSTGMAQPACGAPVTRPNYAGEGERIAAVIIDSIIVFVISLVLFIPLGLSRLLFGGANFLFGLDLLITWGLWLLYFTYFEATTGQTLGKQLLHIRTVDETTLKPLDFPRAFVRNIFRIIDWLPFLYLIGIIVIAIDRQKRRLGDMVAHSIVVKA